MFSFFQKIGAFVAGSVLAIMGTVGIGHKATPTVTAPEASVQQEKAPVKKSGGTHAPTTVSAPLGVATTPTPGAPAAARGTVTLRISNPTYVGSAPLHLKEGAMTTPIVFHNANAFDVTVNSVILSPSIQAVDDVSPAIVRFMDPKKERTAYGNDGIVAQGNIINGAAITLDNMSYTIPANGSRILSVELLSVHRIETGQDPTILLSFSAVNTTPAVVTNADFSLRWTCSTTVGGTGTGAPWQNVVDAGMAC